MRHGEQLRKDMEAGAPPPRLASSSCDDCGSKDTMGFTTQAIWRAVMVQPENPHGWGNFCLPCFVKRAEERGFTGEWFRNSKWQTVPRGAERQLRNLTGEAVRRTATPIPHDEATCYSCWVIAKRGK